MSDIKPTFSGEMQLAGWSQTHTSGNKVTFWLPDDEAMESFKLLTARKGNRAGQRFAAVLVEIGDDELPVDHTEDVLDMVPRALNVVFGDETTAVRTNGAALPMAREECGAGGFISALADQFADAGKTIVETPMEIAQRGLVKMAGILSNDREFWEYVGTMHPVTPTNAEEAAAYIRQESGITSRSELAHKVGAASRFRGMMRSFEEWKSEK